MIKSFAKFVAAGAAASISTSVVMISSANGALTGTPVAGGGGCGQIPFCLSFTSHASSDSEHGADARLRVSGPSHCSGALRARQWRRTTGKPPVPAARSVAGTVTNLPRSEAE
jgi:hypothetical protein